MKTINLKNLDKRKSKSGKTFWIATTNSGNMSVWDADVAEILSNGDTFEVEIKEDGDFKNIISAKAVKSTMENPKMDYEILGKKKAISIVLSYVKDIYISNTNLMAKYCTTKEELESMLITETSKIYPLASLLMTAMEDLSSGEAEDEKEIL